MLSRVLLMLCKLILLMCNELTYINMWLMNLVSELIIHQLATDANVTAKGFSKKSAHNGVKSKQQ